LSLDRTGLTLCVWGSVAQHASECSARSCSSRTGSSSRSRPVEAARAAGGLLVHDRGGYSLTPAAYGLDATVFEALVEQARTEPAKASSLLREALALFRGEPSERASRDPVGELTFAAG
jgi:hypothetical protein